MSEGFVHHAINSVVLGIEAFGILIIMTGGIYSTIRYLRTTRQSSEKAYNGYRSGLARAILLGLEVLVAADIIRTIAVEPNYENLGVLALIVVIRTFLSFSLEVEIHGRWPWQRAH
jgi:uncharacterized membrane protein